MLVDEADVLLDEGEAYAAKLRLADVPVTTVRYDGTCHDFMLLNALSQTKAARGAIAQATAFLRGARTASSSRKTPAATDRRSPAVGDGHSAGDRSDPCTPVKRCRS